MNAPADDRAARPRRARPRWPFGRDVRALVGSSLFIYGLRLGGAGLTFLTQWLLVRWMGEAELGHYVFVFALASLGGFVCTLGLPIVASRVLPPALDQGQAGLVRGFIIASRRTGLVASALLAALGLAVALNVGLPAGAGSLAAWCLGLAMLPLAALLVIQTDIGRAVFLLATSFVPTLVLRHVLTFIGVVVLWAMGASLNAVIVLALTAGAMVLAAVLQHVMLQRRIDESLPAAAPVITLWPWLRSGLPLIFAFGLSGFFLEVNVVLAGLVIAPETLAVYNLAFQLVNLVGYFLTAVGFQVAPHAARLHGAGDRAGLQRAIARASLLRLLFTLAALAGLSVVGPVILALFGPAFAQAEPILLLLGLTLVTGALLGPVEELVPIFELERVAARLAVGALLVNILLTMILVPLYGMMGAAISALATMAVWDLSLMLEIRRRTGIETSILAARVLWPGR